MENFLNFIYVNLYSNGIYRIIFLALIFGFIIFVGIKYSPAKQLKNAYNSINQRLIDATNAVSIKKKKKKFDFNRIHDTLLQNGVLFRFPWLDNPASYLGMKILLAIAFGLLLSVFSPVFFIIGAFIGYKSLDFGVYLLNATDNRKMQADIQLIYNLILIQSKSHINLAYALSDCVDMINPNDRRLKDALKRLRINLFSGHTFKESIKIFNEGFNNQYIDSLCLTLIQAEETGLASDLLKDIGSQVQHFSSLQLSKKKEKMDIKVTIASLLFLASLLAIGLGAGFTELTDALTASGLF